ncbi:YciI family protein [Dyella nitratireducens]|uniref:YCII-related domain-containing protein n=1 Tax=Dyella nitratireducens TaxID=1849580 RepID=A0ABQ1GSC9_9GAMM|nr:YciI family protein [Dyella nitratireducens]GGA49205.1 hypothetical protein GCM10010981_43130 [Dyella nitratireducens]GLQ42210.1 hypothetical protein GCM10007902_20600 [Dyella nitratireducens]
MRHFFCKLHGPRATFPADITPEERALMKEHADYWREQMSKGYAVVFGPVMDPAGAYGILVMQLPDDMAPEPLVDGDPVMKAERGFRFEIHPMHAVLPPPA